jgi:hypothetical protein
MRIISYLGTLDRVFGVSVTTRNWNTMTAIVKVLDNRRQVWSGLRSNFLRRGGGPSSIHARIIRSDGWPDTFMQRSAHSTD